MTRLRALNAQNASAAFAAATARHYRRGDKTPRTLDVERYPPLRAAIPDITFFADGPDIPTHTLAAHRPPACPTPTGAMGHCLQPHTPPPHTHLPIPASVLAHPSSTHICLCTAPGTQTTRTAWAHQQFCCFHQFIGFHVAFNSHQTITPHPHSLPHHTPTTPGTPPLHGTRKRHTWDYLLPTTPASEWYGERLPVICRRTVLDTNMDSALFLCAPPSQFPPGATPACRCCVAFHSWCAPVLAGVDHACYRLYGGTVFHYYRIQ